MSQVRAQHSNVYLDLSQTPGAVNCLSVFVTLDDATKFRAAQLAEMFCLYTQVSVLLIPNTHFNQTEVHLQANAPIAQCIDVTTRSRYPIKSVFFFRHIRHDLWYFESNMFSVNICHGNTTLFT